MGDDSMGRMIVRIAYGKLGLDLEVPSNAEVIVPRPSPGLLDPRKSLQDALRDPTGSLPLRDRVHPYDKVVIVHTDLTRATPNALILPILLEELEGAGVLREDICLLNALGTHRPQTPAELRGMLGDFIVDNYRCLQHDAWDDGNLVPFGETSLGHPVRLNRVFAEATLGILTGFIEPHFFAGFSGGPKGVLPAIAGYESVLSNHGREMIAHPNATWGVMVGNPIWEEMREVALRAGPTFLLNVAMNHRREITGVFAGDVIEAHGAGCTFVGEHALVPVGEPYDVVITTNSGYPQDQNLYQAVKGVSAAARVVRPGGAILLVAACADGLPAHGGYAELLNRGGSPQGVLDLLAQTGFHAHDQWTVQVQAQVQLKADVYLYSDGLSETDIRKALFTPIRDLTNSLADLRNRYGPRTCILPEGPQTIPTLIQGGFPT
jgi:nickel-dependent lactate racemase